MTITAPEVQNTCEQILATLIELERQLERAEGYKGGAGAIARARGAINSVRIMGKQAELATELQEGDCVNIKWKGHGTFRGFIKHEPGKALVDRNGYGPGWYDVDELEPMPLDELRRYVEICESGNNVKISETYRAMVAGYRSQLDRRAA